MTSPTSKLRTCWKVCAAMGLAAIMLLDAPRLAEAQLVQGVEKGAREGNKAAGPVGGVLGGAIGGVVGVVTGVTGVLTGGNKGGQAPAAKDAKQGEASKQSEPAKQGDTSKSAKGAKGTKSAKASDYKVDIDFVDPSVTDLVDVAFHVGKNGTLVIDPTGDDLIQSITIEKVTGPALKLGLGDIDILRPPGDYELTFELNVDDGDDDHDSGTFVVQIDGNGDGIHDPIMV